MVKAVMVKARFLPGLLRCDVVTRDPVILESGANDKLEQAQQVTLPAALCGAIDSTGNATMLQYVDTPTGPQLGRIVDSLGMGMLAQVTDFGYDAAGRMASLRSPLAASALASGALPGVAAEILAQADAVQSALL